MKIGIVGLGYVGLPLAVAFAEAGHEVRGIDLDPDKVMALNAGRSYVEDVPDRRAPTTPTWRSARP
jgi:UDP-N-acetyl-D-glucosamine dehydrogenase